MHRSHVMYSLHILLKIRSYGRHSKVNSIEIRSFSKNFVQKIGNILQKQYMEKVRVLVEFIVPHISKEDIEKIWKMRVEFIRHQRRDTLSNIVYVFSRVAHPLLSFIYSH